MTAVVSTAVAASVAATMAAVETVVVGQRRGMVIEVATEVGAVLVMPMQVVLKEVLQVRVLPVTVV